MHILRACCAYSSRILRMRYASSLRMICVFFAYVTHRLCVWYAYSSCMLHVSSRMLRVSFAHVTPILRKCPRRGIVAPFPPIFRKNVFTMHFWNVNSNPEVLTSSTFGGSSLWKFYSNLVTVEHVFGILETKRVEKNWAWITRSGSCWRQRQI